MTLLEQQLKSLIEQYGQVAIGLAFNAVVDRMMNEAVDRVANNPPPYPFCRHPEDCAGRGYCRHDPACNE